MEHQESLTPEERQNLVAYLDGELNDAAARALEAKLSQSPVARKEAEAMQRTWDLLDYLPRPKAPENFTHRTLERLEVKRRNWAARSRRWRWFTRVAWAAALLIAAGVGFWITYSDQPSPEELRMLKHRRDYEKVDNIDFLQELAQPDLFGEES